jgi:hypothetical protein
MILEAEIFWLLSSCNCAAPRLPQSLAALGFGYGLNEEGVRRLRANRRNSENNLAPTECWLITNLAVLAEELAWRMSRKSRFCRATGGPARKQRGESDI